MNVRIHLFHQQTKVLRQSFAFSQTFRFLKRANKEKQIERREALPEAKTCQLNLKSMLPLPKYTMHKGWTIASVEL